MFFLFISSCGPALRITELTEYQKEMLDSAGKLIYQGDFRKAYQNLMTLKEEKISVPEYYFYEGFVLEKLKKDNEQSIRSLRRALNLLEKEGGERSPEFEASVHFYLGYNMDKLKDKDKSAYHFNTAFSILELQERKGKLTDGISFYQLAYCYDRLNDIKRSMTNYRRSYDILSKEHPNYFYIRGALFNMGRIYYNRDELEQALPYWQKAYEQEPEKGYFKDFYHQNYIIIQEKIRTLEYEQDGA